MSSTCPRATPHGAPPTPFPGSRVTPKILSCAWISNAPPAPWFKSSRLPAARSGSPATPRGGTVDAREPAAHVARSTWRGPNPVTAERPNWPRAEIGGFILSLIDGVTTVESLLHLSGMPAEETLGITKDLRARGIVVLREGLQES